MPQLKSKLLKKNKETKKHEVVIVVSLINKVLRSLYTNTGLFQEHFKDYHFLNSTQANCCN